LAEALWLAAKVFNNSAAVQTPKCREFVNRIVFVMTDGSPWSNLVAGQPVAGFEDFPTSFLGDAGTSATGLKSTAGYVETLVPQQAKVLKDMNARIIMVGLAAGGEVPTYTNYFKGLLVPERKCTQVAANYFGATTTTAKNNWCSGRGISVANQPNSQCFRHRKQMIVSNLVGSTYTERMN